MASVEEILMAKAMADARDKPDPAVAMGVGAAGGAALGVLAGAPAHSLGNQVNKALGRNPRMLRPGFRAAGGLVGAILGGGLGLGVREMMVQESPAANMLARIQAQQGELNAMDRAQLQSVLKDIYNQGGM